MQINFNLSATIRKEFQAKMREGIRDRFTHDLPEEFEFPPEQYHRKQLIEAAELLFALTLRLRDTD